jgi:hypothetical protein
MASSPTRREFLTECARFLAGSGFAISVPALATLVGCAREAAENGAAFQVLTPAEGLVVSAFAERIFPSGLFDPGASDAGAVHFIDQALTGSFGADRQLVSEGVVDLDRRAAERAGPGNGFASLDEPDQIGIMTEMEGTDFFERLRTLVLAGIFADPSWGGNRNEVGWKHLDFAHQPTYLPPFGYYDEAANATGTEGSA